VPEYFEDNWIQYRQFIETEQNSKAINAALELLSNRKQANPVQYSADHKGTPFYVLGYAAFASHDYPSASLYFDAAVAADLRYHTGNLNTSALRFMQLLHTQGEPLLARDIIAKTEASAEQLLDDYRRRGAMHNIRLDELRTRFFKSILTTGPASRRTLITAFISFVAEWPYRAKQFELIEEGSREPFFLHLFRGCLLFESLLKGAPGAPRLLGLGDALRHYRGQLGLAAIRTRANTFNDIVASLTPSMDIEPSIHSCAKSRNTLGHNLVWATTDLTPQTYDPLVKNIAASCLHAISKLYR
jgi:hypothetical protein